VQKIKKLENVYKIYQKQLLEEGTVKQEDLKELQDHVSGIMSSEFEEARTYKPEVSAGLHFPDLFMLGLQTPHKVTVSGRSNGPLYQSRVQSSVLRAII
jgi:2-oxoglutarate dehydrogenase complex dehydrogenase (E1) component-like enzyme